MNPGGRVALVTGAGRGIGRACAIALSKSGHRVALTARTAAELDETAALCARLTATDPLVIPADLTDSVDAIFDRCEAALGPVDVLVANAGMALTGPLTRLTDDDWQRMIDINLTAPFRCMRRALPSMQSRDWGRIVVMGSVASRQGAPFIAGYAATKHGVLGLVRAAAAEVAGTGVTVNAVCPGFVDSPMTDESVERIVTRTSRAPAEARALLERQNASGKLITPDEVAAAVMFCVGSPSVNGQGINVDGGTVQS